MADPITDTLVKEILQKKLQEYYRPEFIETDPVCIPHLFEAKEDIEISGFLTATISWGNRKAIIQSANRLMQLMDFSPFKFVMQHTRNDIKKIKQFYYRTFQPDDVIFFFRFLRRAYAEYGSLENAFFPEGSKQLVEDGLRNFRKFFISCKPPLRTLKHFPDIDKGATAKRMCMYFRWMTRKCDKGIDFGIWKKIRPRDLYMPVDVHTHRALTHLGILYGKNPRWKDVELATAYFRNLCVEDPCRYDFALFGMGMEWSKKKN
jgi:uncharacterized protein (TIGR02757 family)